MTKIRAYCYREPPHCFLPRDVLDVLGAPQHVQQGRLIVFAPTATHAAMALSDVGLGLRATRDLALATGNDATALTEAGMKGDGLVWAMPLDGARVVAAVFREHGGRTAVRVGEIRHRDGAAVFVSDDELERITDTMIDAAYDTARAHGEDIDRETVGAMLAAALDTGDTP